MNAKQANRAARRAAEKAKPKFLRGTKEEKMRKLLQNGITPEMLEDEFRQGYDAGSKAGIEYTFKAIYAAVMLASKELYGFHTKRASRLLRRVDELVSTAITDEDMVDEVWRQFGLELEFQEGVDRIKEIERGGEDDV